jgi:hypothetical protein
VEPSTSSRCVDCGSSSTPVDILDSRQESDRGVSGCEVRLSDNCTNVDVLVVSVANNNDSYDVGGTQELAGLSHLHCPSNVLNDLVLSKFHDCHKQNVVHFFA